MSDVLQQVESGVMTLTLNRLDKKNSFTAAMYAELAEALRGAADDAACAWCCFRAMKPFSVQVTTSVTFSTSPPARPTPRCFVF